ARFHRHHYRPENVTVIAIGNLPPEDLADAVIEGFDQRRGSLGSSSVDDKEDLRSPSHIPLPPFETIVRQDHEDPVLQQARLAMVWRGPGLTASDQCNPLDVLSTILARGRTSRLVRELREELGLVNYVTASNLTYADQGLFYVSAQLPEDNIEAVEACIRRHIERLRTEPVTPSELARVKTRVANSFIFGNETPSNRAGLYGYYETLMGNIHQGLQYPADIRSLTVEDLQASAKRWLNPDAYGLVTVRPGKGS
ncbi:MAG: pitrilysin family protein, partial [Cyanobacteria bacterium P01_H01_bin.130]